MRLTAGLVLGIGLGGFIDGITLHQIMQWHNMGSAILPPVTMEAMSQNMVWDGLFHAGTLSVTLILGWGVFNLVEGLIDHHLLQLHHVRDMPFHIPAYDWIFLAIAGVVFTAIGWLLARSRPTVHSR